jgi:hypothetical protein
MVATSSSSSFLDAWYIPRVSCRGVECEEGTAVDSAAVLRISSPIYPSPVQGFAPGVRSALPSDPLDGACVHRTRIRLDGGDATRSAARAHRSVVSFWVFSARSSSSSKSWILRCSPSFVDFDASCSSRTFFASFSLSSAASNCPSALVSL